MIIEYPISANYCKSWTVREAIREIIANARDEGEFIIRWDDGRATIQDFGKGIAKQFFVLGEGESKADTQIGQFREGLKIAGLVMAREGRQMQGNTLAYTFAFSMGLSEAFDCPVVMLELNDAPTTIGTIISFQCTKDEMEDAKALFLPDDVAKAECLLSDGNQKGKLYINGVYVQTIKSLFGYNIIDKSAANRDRSVLDTGSVNKAIARIWQGNTNMQTVTMILQETDQYIEHSAGIVPVSNKEAQEVWMDGVRSIYGEKYALIDEHAHILVDRGYRIIEPLTFSLKWEMHVRLAIPNATDILKRRESLDFTDIFRDLDRDTRLMISQARQIAEGIVGEKLTVHIVKDCSLEDEDVLSTYDPKDRIVRVAKKTLDRGFEFLIGTLIHEGIHQTSHAHDSSAEFEWAMTLAFSKTAARSVSVWLGRN